MMASLGAEIMIELFPSDILYSPLPLYHLATGVMGVGLTLLSGPSTIVRKKFSASNYFADCVRYHATVCLRSLRMGFHLLSNIWVGGVDYYPHSVVVDDLK